MEEFKPSMQKRVQEMIAARPKEKAFEATSTKDQIEAAKMLEIEAQKRDERKQKEQAYIKEIQEGIKKIELDIRPDSGNVENIKRGAHLRSEERKWGEAGPDDKLAA